MNIIVVNSGSQAGAGYEGTLVIPDGTPFEDLIKVFLKDSPRQQVAIHFIGWLFDNFPVMPNTSDLYFDSNGMSIYGPDGSCKSFKHALCPVSNEEG